MTVHIRAERIDDAAAVWRVNEAAFGRPNEAALVDALRATGAVIASLVAEVDGDIAGHALFSVAALHSHSDEGQGVVAAATPGTAADAALPIAALGPMAVLPDHQRQGIGGALIAAGLAACRAAGYDLCIVLGHADYYPRFGFRPAPPQGIRWEHGADAHFFVIELQPGALAGRRGVVRYRPEFDTV